MNHISIDLSLDFDKKVVRGWALHECLDGETIELDTRDLEISSVEDDADGEFEAIDFRLGDEDPIEGRKLRIEPREGALHIRVHYESSPEAPGLQWLAASQTKDGKAPFVYSQGQSNHNRSWLPCVDDPAQRITFDATLRVPGGIRAVMAAQDNSDPDEAGVFRFQMPQPIPSYLIAMAAGVLEFWPLGERAGVWAEPSLVEACAHEFADTESMIAATERLFGAYRWGRYDLLVLPPSFPLGGMENPRLTFATPTILAGDRSLVSLVAHELAHSWSGNLVTNETWDDFWLNEGFTVYIERRILEAVYGRERSEMEASIGRQRLEACIEELGVDSPDTCLQLNLAGREPDSAMTDVPYEKGYLLLRSIEEAYGRERFDAFLRSYFDQHAFETMTTARWITFVREQLLDAEPTLAAAIDLEAWIYSPGIPEHAPRAQTDAFDRAAAAADAFATKGQSPDQHLTEAWTPHEWIHFLRALPPTVSASQLDQLAEAHQLDGVANAETRCEWLLLCTQTGRSSMDAAVEEFLCSVGRRKFLKPLYDALAARSMDRARSIYAKARPMYHAMARRSFDAELL